MAKKEGAHSPKLVPALMDLGEWDLKSLQWGDALRVYRRVIAIVEATYGADSPRLVLPLQRMSEVFWREGRLVHDGREALARGVQILEAANADMALQADALINLGDWDMRADDDERAMVSYAAAWKRLVEADGGGLELAQKRLGHPKRVYYTPPQVAPTDSDMYVIVQFTVAPHGIAENATIAESNAPASVRDDVLAAVEHATFRLALVDGAPVAMTHRLRQTFGSRQ